MSDREEPLSASSARRHLPQGNSLLQVVAGTLARLTVDFHAYLESLSNPPSASKNSEVSVAFHQQVGSTVGPEFDAETFLTRSEAAVLIHLKESELGQALYNGWFRWKPYARKQNDSKAGQPDHLRRPWYLLLKADVLEYKALRDSGRANCYQKGFYPPPPRPGHRLIGRPIIHPHPIRWSLCSPMPTTSTISFAAICDGRPDDQLHGSLDRLHTVAILQDQTPGHLIALAERISARLGSQGLRTWAGRAPAYRRRFADALAGELPSTGFLCLSEARESEMIACLPHIARLLPPRAHFTVHAHDGQPTTISVRGHTTNERTQQVVPPRASWPVGVVVSWTSLAIAAFYAHAEESAIRNGQTPPTMFLLPDRFPRDDQERPGATSLLRALLHYQLGDRILQQYAGPPRDDNPAEVLIDNIVGLFNQRHDEPDSEASQATFRMLAEPTLHDHLVCERLNVEELRRWK